jgi:hypothetical protein
MEVVENEAVAKSTGTAVDDLGDVEAIVRSESCGVSGPTARGPTGAWEDVREAMELLPASNRPMEATQATTL